MDRMMNVLTDEYRRRLLLGLAEYGPGEEVSTPEIVDEIGSHREILRIEMIHHHLPRLDEAGFVDWDRDARTISRGPQFEQIEPFVELVAGNSPKIA